MQRGKQPLGYLFCPECNSTLNRIFPSKKCSDCGRFKATFRCSEILSHPNQTICEYCELKKETSPKLEDKRNTETGIPSYIIPVIVVLVLLGFLLYIKSSRNQELDSARELLKKLRKEFPSQRNETWNHILSVLDKKIPSVKTITFLHGEDKKTPDCLTNKMVFLSSGNKDIKSDEITFSAVGYEGKDYGFALEHYRTIVEKFRVFITDLTTVPGNIARIFHSLCDEVSSDIKPSLFIFTLKYDKSTAGLKPIERAGRILMKAWSDLPHNEVFPLLSRVAKNVVEILPEEQISC